MPTIQVPIGQLAQIIKTFGDSDIPLMIYGPPGIGKSDIMQQTAIAKADEMKRDYVHWNKISNDEKEKVIANPKKYFIFYDMRLSQAEPTSISGIPNMSAGAKRLELMPWGWTVAMSHQDAAGYLFFDEINLAPPAIAAAAYQAIHDRVIADTALSKEIRVFAAGNRSEDKAFTFDMPFPLKDRFGEIEAVMDATAWFNWAAGKVNPHLITFCKWKESYLYRTSKDGADKASTPRGICRASTLIAQRDIITDPQIYRLLSAAVGETFANEFLAYQKVYQKLDWDNIYKNPNCVKGFEIDQLWAVTGGLVERYSKDKTQKHFDQVAAIILEMKTDFAVTALSQISKVDKTAFRNFSTKNQGFFKQMQDKYWKFLA